MLDSILPSSPSLLSADTNFYLFSAMLDSILSISPGLVSPDTTFLFVFSHVR